MSDHWNTQKMMDRFNKLDADVEVSGPYGEAYADCITFTPKGGGDSLELMGKKCDYQIPKDPSDCEVDWVSLNDGQFEDVHLATRDHATIQLYADVMKILADLDIYVLPHMPEG